MLRDPPHYLRALTTTTVPRRLAFLDCATETRPEQGCYVDRWAFGELGTTHWTSKKGVRRDTASTFHDPQALWCVLSDWCVNGKRVVLWAHDLAYQLRVSQALVHLPALGWRLDRIVLERHAAWALFRHGKRTLMCCDLRSWAPCDLGKLGYQGPRVEQVRQAVITLLDWIASEGLGPFRPTGSGQGYAAYRRRFMKHHLLVHDDAERLEAERAAMWTGRCEAWRHGHLTNGPYVEYDLVVAYATIASESLVPAVAGRTVNNPSLATIEKLIGQGAVLTHCQIETDVPCVPTKLADRTVWPIGRFDTYLWEPELQLAHQYAQNVKHHKAWFYHTQPALKDFADWVLSGMNGGHGQHPEVIRRLLKHWSRTMVGRLALRYRSWERFGTQPDPDLRLTTYIDVDEGTVTDFLIAGTDRLILTDLQESLDSLPQIPGWVMSMCRRRLWDAMTVANPSSHLVYCDTDSVIFDGFGADCMGLYARHHDAAWAIKGRYPSLTVHGPRNLVAHKTRRVSGLPLSAKQVAPLEFTGEVMRSIKESMRAGQLDHVATIPRRFVLDAPDMRRQHHPDGTTTPYRLEGTRAPASSHRLL